MFMVVPFADAFHGAATRVANVLTLWTDLTDCSTLVVLSWLMKIALLMMMLVQYLKHLVDQH